MTTTEMANKAKRIMEWMDMASDLGWDLVFTMSQMAGTMAGFRGDRLEKHTHALVEIIEE